MTAKDARDRLAGMSLSSTLRSSALGQNVILPLWRSVYSKRNWIYRNSLLYPSRKRRYYERYAVDPSLTPRQEELQTLLRDGVLVLPNFFDRDTVHRMLREVVPLLEEVRSGTYKGSNKPTHDKQYGVYRLWGIDKLCSSTLSLFEHPDILSIAKAYVSRNVVSYNRMAELRPDPGRVSIADHPHIDDWRVRFKSFLYLTDVGPRQAPFTYFIGSHRQDAPWRQRIEARYFRAGADAGYLTPEEQQRILPLYEEKAFTAPAGTVILADLRGIHRGTPLIDGRRVLLANYFDVR